jgi:serine phosphatase RsbU (regulator of sigma subunit)
MFALLRRIPLFDGLADHDLARMVTGVTERLLDPGDTLFCQNDEGHDCYVILTGALEVITYLNGAEIQLEVRHEGQIIGEMALIDRSPRSATVRAVTSSRLAVLNEQHFADLMRSDPALAMKLLRDGTMRLRSTNQRMIADLEAKNAELSRAYHELKAAQADLIRLNRIEEELAVARRIQSSFLPRELPQPDGWRVAAYSRGAQAVGGDFFDCIELPEGRLGLIVADACGKGVTAALFVALTRSLLRAASQAPWAFQGKATLDPNAVLSGAIQLTNDYMLREHGDNHMFVTLFYAVLEPRTGHLSYINAGHNPPLILSSDGATVRELEVTTFPIGINPSQAFEIATATLAAGEVLFGFSDGITEALNAVGQMYSDERLVAELHAYAGIDADRFVETLIASVDQYVADAPQSDDITLLVVQRLL